MAFQGDATGHAHRHRADVASGARAPRVVRKLALVLLAASLPVPVVQFFTWPLAATGLTLLVPARETRRGAITGLVVLVTSLLAALLLAGTIRGVPTVPASRHVAGLATMAGALAAWFATAALLVLTPGAAPRILPRAGAALILATYGILVWEALVLAGGITSPFLFRDNLLLGLFTLGAVPIVIALAWEILAPAS